MDSQPDSAQVEFERQVEALRRRYVAGLPDRRTALAEAWVACSDGGAEGAWLQLREAAHRLSGSAPCYGFDALGAAARELDRCLSGHAPCRDAARVRPLVDRLLAALDVAAGST